MNERPTLDYRPPDPGRTPFHRATFAAAAFVAFGWFTAVVFHFIPRPLPAVSNAVGLGLVLLGMLRPRGASAERVTQIVVLVAAIVGMLL
jgi:hypothetical protein